MAEGIVWAGDLAASLLAPLGERWAHTLAVVERARAFSHALPVAQLDVLVAAAYLHGLGYAPELAHSGFHPLDGALFLRGSSHERLACLVAHHSGARFEAEERGVLEELERFPEERSLVAEALTYCDLTTAPDGSRTAASTRLSEIAARHGDDHPVGRAIRRSREELLPLVSRVATVEREVATAEGRGRGSAQARRGGAAA